MPHTLTNARMMLCHFLYVNSLPLELIVREAAAQNLNATTSGNKFLGSVGCGLLDAIFLACSLETIVSQ